MAAYTPDLSSPLSNTTGGTTAGETPTPITPAGGGDSIALIGSKVTLWFVTTGTGSTVTLDSVRASDQGNDNNLTVTLPATGVRRVVIEASNDRFKQVSGNVGYLNLTYTSVVGLTIYAWYTA
jgi:hypothetical protein